MPRRKTHEEFMREFYEKNTHAQDIEILGTYINAQTKIKCKCKIDGYEWETRPNDLLREHGCPKCGYKRAAQKNAKTHEQFMKAFYKKTKHAQDIKILGTYVNTETKIKCGCKKCGYEWETRPADLLHGKGCPQCAGNVKLTQEEVINRLHQVNPDIEVLGTYNGNKTKIKVRCKICGHIWKALPNNLLKGSGCPKCNTSKGEKRITQYLDNLGMDYIYDKPYFKDLISTGGNPLRPDFIIPSLTMWIEYDGIQHYNPRDFRGGMNEQQLQEQFEKVQQNDQIKNQYAKANNWILVRIPYYEYDNIEQILDSYLEEKNINVG